MVPQRKKPAVVRLLVDEEETEQRDGALHGTETHCTMNAFFK